MDCSTAVKLLTSLVDGQSEELNLDRAQIEAHLKVCRKCAIEFNNQRLIKNGIAKVRLADPQKELNERIKKALSAKESPVLIPLRYASSLVAACLVIVLIFALQKSADAEPPEVVKSSALYFDRILENDVAISAARDSTAVCGCIREKLPGCNLEIKGFKCSCTRLQNGEYACVVYSKDGQLIGIFPCDQLSQKDLAFKTYEIGKNNVLVQKTAKGTIMCVSRLPVGKLKELLNIQ